MIQSRRFVFIIIDVFMKLTSGKKRSLSSSLWLQRQQNDPYVKQAQKFGYRSRAAYKLKELNAQFRFLKPGTKVLDLGAAPGGWLQVVSECTKPKQSGSKIVGVDLLEIKPIPEISFIHGDFYDQAIVNQILQELNGKADVILSDMAPSTMGHKSTDHIRMMGLCEAAWDFVKEHLAEHGTFVVKLFQGGMVGELLSELKPRFSKIKHVKPPASRKESSEIYLVALDFKSDT